MSAESSDLAINHACINAWLDEANLPNVQRPVVIDLESDLNKSLESDLEVDGIYTANTLHIISWPLVIKFFEGVGKNLASKGHLCIYGPFNYQGKFTSASNANFELWLKDRDINSGIRDIEAILELASAAGLSLLDEHTMPANNRLLVFSKT